MMHLYNNQKEGEEWTRSDTALITFSVQTWVTDAVILQQILECQTKENEAEKDSKNEEKVHAFFFIIDVARNQTKQTDKNVEREARS